MSDEFTAADTAFPPDSSVDIGGRPGGRDDWSASHRISDAIDAGRGPDMPLDILARLVREASLHSLAIAFLLGVAVARRR